jgi:hydroxymethylbilane synthase
VYKSDCSFLQDHESNAIVATSSMRRKAQWLNRYRHHQIENLRGNVNTRLRKIQENEWQGAIFAAAGLERINLRPSNAVELDWMLPAPAQGAIVIVCRENDPFIFESVALLNHPSSEICTKVERDFLRHLMGGCSTPISSLATVSGNNLFFKGNILSLDGKEKADIELTASLSNANELGMKAAQQLLTNGGQKIAESIYHATRQQ